MEKKRKALYQEKEGEGSESVRCLLCPHFCVIAPGKSGTCKVRVNAEGTLIASAHGVLSALALDPVEKKPLASFFPGSRILSAGFYGCNLSCAFCQNHEISQTGVPPAREKSSSRLSRVTSAELVLEAKNLMDRGNIGIAYTYNEPLTNFEYVIETAALARAAGLKNVIVTNGYINPEPLLETLPFIDAMNIDLKAGTDSFYRTVCGGSLEPVKASIELVARFSPHCHLEVTTLVIPGLNDSDDEIDLIASWLASVSPDIPLHLTRHHGDFRMRDSVPVEPDRLRALADRARKYLRTVHCGNIRSGDILSSGE